MVWTGLDKAEEASNATLNADFVKGPIPVNIPKREKTVYSGSRNGQGGINLDCSNESMINELEAVKKSARSNETHKQERREQNSPKNEDRSLQD